MNFSGTLDRPKLVSMVDQVTLSQHSSYVILCNLMSGTKPVFFEWNKNGHKLVSSDQIKVDHNDFMSMVTLHNVTAAESGQYECLVKNALGMDSSSTRVNINGK